MRDLGLQAALTNGVVLRKWSVGVHETRNLEEWLTSSISSSLELSSTSIVSWVCGSTAALPFPLPSEMVPLWATFSFKVADPFWSAILVDFEWWSGICLWLWLWLWIVDCGLFGEGNGRLEFVFESRDHCSRPCRRSRLPILATFHARDD